jgi:hypothetical protein
MGQWVGALGGAIVAASAVWYALDVLRGSTRPQRTSWGVWAVVGAVGFGTSDAGGAGAGSYAAAADAGACVLTFLLSLHPRLGKPGGRRLDPVLAAAALAGVALWLAGPLTADESAACATACAAVALWPTLRDSWRQPRLESLPSWGADVVGNALCLAALQRLTPAALAFPAYLTAAAAVMVVVLFGRRRVTTGAR